MSEIKKHYMRAKRKTSQEESFSSNRSKIVTKKFCSELNTNENSSQPELFEHGTLESALLLNYESDENLSLSSDLQLVNFDINKSHDTTEEKNNLEEDIQLHLIQWSLQHNISHAALNDLLKLLKSHIPKLPNDARTILGTCRTIVSKVIEPGQYYHFGVENCIKNLIYSSNDFFKNNGMIELAINIDGLPLAKSSGSQVYPILCRLVKHHSTVEMIGIYHGYQKPKNANCYLNDFVKDVSNIINTGIIFDTKHYSVKISHFVCDAVAKSYITYTIGHMGFYSCTKCYEKGVYINNRVCFSNTNHLHLRTDTCYRTKIQEEHHNGTSILEQIPGLDMIKSFPLDYMHLICLGVVKKLIVNLWCFGKSFTKLSHQNIANISSNLINQANNIPIEFNRKPRSLLEAKRWKATEFRQFLFYTGPVVLRKILNNDRYINFLTLHVAIIILTCPKYSHLINYASTLLLYFVNTFKILYGAENISHNVHNLLHLVEDVKIHGPLDNFSAFPFENYLQTILKSIRKGEKPLAQIIKRKSEQNFHATKIVNITSKKYPIYEKEHFNGPIINLNICKQFKRIILQDYMLCIDHPNNCCTLINGDIILIKNIVYYNNEFKFIGRKFLIVENFYTCPCESKEIGIFVVDNVGPLEIFDVADISFKCVILNWEEKHVVFPLIHANINC